MSPSRKAAESSAETTTCPWCSSIIPADAAKCPSCGASLRDAVDGDIAGVTQVDPTAASKLARLARQKPGRLAGWLGAEQTADSTQLGGRIEPPSDEVRREMLRLELAALDAEIEAKAQLAEAQKVLPPEDAAEPNPG